MVRGPVDRMAKGDVAILSLAILSGLRSVGKNVRTLAVRRGSKYDLFTAFHPIWMRLRYTHCLIILKKVSLLTKRHLNFDAKNPQNQHSYQQTQLWRFLARKCKYIWQINKQNKHYFWLENSNEIFLLIFNHCDMTYISGTIMAQNGWSTKMSGRQTYENTWMQSNALPGKMGQYRYVFIVVFP